MKQAVQIHIEELVLHGFPPSDKYRIAAGLEQGLVRLIEREGVPGRILNSEDIYRLDAGEFRLEPYRKPETIGERVAGAIYGGLNYDR